MYLFILNTLEVKPPLSYRFVCHHFFIVRVYHRTKGHPSKTGILDLQVDKIDIFLEVKTPHL